MEMANENGTLLPIPPVSGSAEVSIPSRISVLYIDTTPALLDAVRQFLEMNGDIMVDTSVSGKEAIEKLEYITYDVIVTDYNIRGMGNALLSYLRNHGNLIPFVYFVLFRSVDLECEAQNYGNVSFVEKLKNKENSPFLSLYHSIIKGVQGNDRSLVGD
jgi:DNA-binding NtrC family response regulator